MDSPEKYSENPDYNSNDGQINFFKYEGADGIKEECLENSKNLDKDYNENPSTEGEGIEVPINPEQLGIKLEGPLDSDDEGESGDIPAFNPDQLLGMMKYECTQCDKVFARQQYLRIHIKSIHGGSNFACDLCDFTTNRKDGLKHHRESIHEGVVYPCDKCEYVANYKQRLKNHKLNVHLGVKFPCSTCDYVGNNAPALKYHLETAHSGLIFPCNMCDFVANGPINLKRHKKSQHETSARRPVLQLSCDQCDFVTKSAKWLEKHKNSEHDVVHECKHCFKVFARLQYLRIHVKATHTEARFSCDQCEYVTGRKDVLKSHMETKHEGITYPCDECNFVANYRKRLKAHKEKVHLGLTYPCTTCEYVSDSPENLKNHQAAVHEGIVYLCDLCEYVTKWPHCLNRHKKSKHEETRYPCDQCEYIANRSDNLKHHKKIIHSAAKAADSAKHAGNLSQNEAANAAKHELVRSHEALNTFRDFTKLTERNEPANVAKDERIRSHEALNTFRDFNKHEALNTFPTGLDLGLKYRHEARHQSQEKSDFESRDFTKFPEIGNPPSEAAAKIEFAHPHQALHPFPVGLDLGLKYRQEGGHHQIQQHYPELEYEARRRNELLRSHHQNGEGEDRLKTAFERNLLHRRAFL